MAHEFNSGLFVGTPAWHGLGVVVKEAPTIAEAIKMAGMDWTIEQTDLGFAGCPGWKRLNRSDNGEFLHTCKKSWTPLNNIKAFQWFDPLIQDGDVTLETAVSLRGGKQIAIVGKINNLAGEVVPGDALENYILLFNSHDASLSVGVKFTNIRVVCANTLGAATVNEQGNFAGVVNYSKDGKSVRIKHTKAVEANLASVRNAIDMQKRSWDENLQGLKAMADTEMNVSLFRQYLETIFKPAQPNPEKPFAVEALPGYSDMLQMFHSGVGSHIPGVAGTAWQGFQAVTEYHTHTKGRTQESRVQSQWFGDSSRVIGKARIAALELAYAK